MFVASLQDGSAGISGALPHWQWEAFDKKKNLTFFMLNTDFELFFDLDLDEEGKAVCDLDTTCIASNTCGKRNTCRLAKTFHQGKKYIEVGTFILM